MAILVMMALAMFLLVSLSHAQQKGVTSSGRLGSLVQDHRHLSKSSSTDECSTTAAYHAWDFRECEEVQKCSPGATDLMFNDEGVATNKAKAELAGGAICASNKEGVKMKVPDPQNKMCSDVENTGQYINIESWGTWGGGGWSFEVYLKFEKIFSGVRQRVFDFSGPNTPPNAQENNVMLNTYGSQDASRALFEVWSGTTPSRYLTENPFFTENEWVHVVITVPQTNSAPFIPTFYKNGVKVNASLETGSDGLLYIDVVDRNENFLGRSSFFYSPGCPTVDGYTGDYENFDGIIAFMRIYNKELSATEVGQLYSDSVLQHFGCKKSGGKKSKNKNLCN